MNTFEEIVAVLLLPLGLMTILLLAFVFRQVLRLIEDIEGHEQARKVIKVSDYKRSGYLVVKE